MTARLGDNGKRVTAADIARSLGISRATVGFVLNDTAGQTISEATRRRVLDEARRLGYRPHTTAQRLASGRSRIVLMLLPEWPLDHSMRAHIDEASLVLDRAGYSLVTTAPHPGGQAVPLWESLSPDAVVAFAPISAAQYDAIRATGAQTLIPGFDDLGANADLHFADGPRHQVEHLVARSRRRIAFAGSTDPRLAALVTERRELAEASLRELTGRDLVASIDIDAGSAAGALDGFLAVDADAIVAYNDDVAALLVGAALRVGVAVPERLAVIGHDDSPLAELFVPALSSIRVDTAGLGRFLAEHALSLVAGGDAPAVPAVSVELVARETT